MGKNAMKSVSKFIIPAYTDDIGKFLKEMDKDNIAWKRLIFINNDSEKPANIMPRYLSPCVDLHFAEKKVRDISVYELTEEGYAQKGIPAKGHKIRLCSSIKKRTDAPETFSFSLKSISLRAFSTGILFVVIEIQYPPEYGIDQISDFAFSFSRLLLKSDEMVFEEAETDSVIDLCASVKQLIRKDNSTLIAEEDGMLGYHAFVRRVKELDETEWRKYAKALSRGLPSNAQIDNSDIFEKSIDYCQSEGIYWFGDSISMVSFNEYLHGDDFDFVPVHFKNVSQDYFLLYLLAIHAREFLIHVYSQIVALNQDHKKLLKLKRKIVLFEASFLHEAVSKHSTYQYFYDELVSLFNIEKLSKDIRNSLLQLDDYLKEKSVRRRKAFTLFISVFGVVGITNNVLGLVNSINGGLSAAHYCALIIELIFVVSSIGYFIFSRK